MNLMELCEPLFYQMCAINRGARRGGVDGHMVTRDMVLSSFDSIEAKAAEDPALASQYSQVEKFLKCFVDFTIQNSGLPFAGQWEVLSEDVAAFTHFFDALDYNLKDHSPGAADRIAIFYTCMGLGFSPDQSPQEIQQKMQACLNRMGPLADKNVLEPLSSPEEHRPDPTVFKPPGKSIAMIVVAMILVLAVIFLANLTLFSNASSELRAAIQTILDHGR